MWLTLQPYPQQREQHNSDSAYPVGNQNGDPAPLNLYLLRTSR
jgi:hypothetical protein